MDDFERQIQRYLEEDRKAESDLSRRIDAAVAEREEFRQRLQFFEALLTRYRRDAVPNESVLSRSELETMAPRGLMRLWADKHGGRLVMSELTAAIAATGRYGGKRDLVSSNLYRPLRKMSDFKKVKPGVYRRRAATEPGVEQDVPISGVPMTSPDVTATVQTELAQIQKGGLEQNLFRAVYQNVRTSDLSNDREVRRSESMARAITIYREQQPDFEPAFNHEYFTERPTVLDFLASQARGA